MTATQALLLLGTSHRRAPLALRERLHLSAKDATSLACMLAANGGEAVVLSTCNRTELYLVAHGAQTAARSAQAALAGRAALPELELAHVLYRADDEHAARHLFRVAAGLDSLVPGEPHVLGQVRAAYESAHASAAAGPLLSRLFRQALHTGKRARSETRIAEQARSVPQAAVQLARQILGDLTGRRILIIGAGKMSELAAAGLASLGVAKLAVANRTVEKAAELADRFGGEAVGFEHLGEQLGQADVVISSTRCPRVLVPAELVTAALRRRKGRPLLLIDIAVPRDIDPAIRQLPGCQLYDIDDLRTTTGDSLGELEQEAARAEAIVGEELERFREWWLARWTVPAIAALHRHAHAIRAAELERAAHEFEGLSPRQQRAVETITGQIVGKLLHAPTVRLKEVARTPGGLGYAEAVDYLFGLSDGR